MKFSIFKKILIALTMAFPALASAAPGEVTSVQMIHNGDLMTVNLGLDLSGLNLKKDQAAIFTPMLVNGPDTLWLNGVGVYGRTRWYQAERARTMPLGGDGELSLRYHKVMDPVMLSQHVGYQEWMNGSELMLRRADYGCAGCGQGQPVITDIAAYEELRFENPEFFFQEAVAEAVKTREIHGRAYVDFPVNKIAIYPDYRNNTYELGKIIATIDSIKNDPDISVNSLHIAGTASPEGPYDNNVYLAKNRTKALKDYVQNLYKFPEGFITTSYEPVDWAGLREWLENNNLPHKDQILAIVNSDIEPFARNSKIMKDYPEDYEFLLRQVHPRRQHPLCGTHLQPGPSHLRCFAPSVRVSLHRVPGYGQGIGHRPSPAAPCGRPTGRAGGQCRTAVPRQRGHFEKALHRRDAGLGGGAPRPGGPGADPGDHAQHRGLCAEKQRGH